MGVELKCTAGEIQLYWDLAFLKSRKRFIAYVSGLNSLSIQFSTYMQAIELPELECTPDKPCHDPKARSHGEGCAVCVFGTLKRDHQDKYGRQVEYVHKIVVPDCLDHPHTNEEIENALAGLDVRVLDWRKKDISLMLLRKVARNVERLHLYSSGSTELLSYWTSYMGLYRFRKVKSPIAIHVLIRKTNLCNGIATRSYHYPLECEYAFL